MNRFEIVDVSYKTHPDLELLKAIHMTSALPMIFSPCCIGEECFVDGGMISNYPLNYCIKNNNITDQGGYEEILGLRNNYEKDPDSDFVNNIVNQESTILDYMMTFINKLVLTVDTEKNQPGIENEVAYSTKHASFSFLKSAISSREVREKLLTIGIEASRQFLSLKQKKEDKNEEKNEDEQQDKHKDETIPIVNPEDSPQVL
jgi:predicted acylesterase/phospholipase RssA